MNYLVITYSLYLVISVCLTIWVASTLHKNGRPFLLDCFVRNEALADSINHLLVVGFYLINIGFVCLYLKIGADVAVTADVFEVLSTKIGVVLLVLGGMHFFNLFLFARMRRRAQLRYGLPPIEPESTLPVEP